MPYKCHCFRKALWGEKTHFLQELISLCYSAHIVTVNCLTKASEYITMIDKREKPLAQLLPYEYTRDQPIRSITSCTGHFSSPTATH